MFMVKNTINRTFSITIVIAILVTAAAILTVQSSSSMLQPSYAQSLSFQSCPDGSTPDASGNCPTEAPPAGDGETAEAPPATETPPPAAPPAGGGETTLTVPEELGGPYVVNKNSSAYLTGYNYAISYGSASDGKVLLQDEIRSACVSLSNTSSVQDDCAGGYSDGITALSDPAFQQSADFVKGMLAAHNRERHLVGLPDLVWDKELAAGSKAWAEHISQTGYLVHHGSYPENIADGLDGAGSWILEKHDIQKKYQGGPVSQFIESLSQDERATAGHYLNMVQPTWKAVAGGTAENPYQAVVCRYSLEGVVQGQ
jgi:uncharacterized protein YkwD